MVMAGVPLLCSSVSPLKLSKSSSMLDSTYNLAHADDLQIHGHSSTSEATRLAADMPSCIETVNAWMASNRLRLNPPETEFI